MINKVIEKVDVKYIVYSIVAIISFFSLYSSPTRILGDPFGLNKGYSFLWLAIMYFLGACIKKFQLHTRVSLKRILIVLSVLFFLTLGPKLILALIRMESLGILSEKIGRVLVDYMSPTIVGISIGLLMIFARMKINLNMSKLIRKITPHVFGVYLLHDNMWVRQYIISGKFDFITSLNLFLMVCAIVGVASVIFLLGILIDKTRSLLFGIFKIDKLIEWCEKVITVSYLKIEEIIMKFL